MILGKDNKKILHRAPFVLPVTSPMIKDGAVLTTAGKILAVAPFADLQKEADVIVEHEEKVLTPALINCHAHLELSFLAASENSTDFASQSITDWILDLLLRRESSNATDTEIMNAARESLQRLHEGGVALVADIGNNPASCQIAENSPVEVHFFHELMAVNFKTLEFATQVLDQKKADDNCTAHALYSTKSELVQRLKKRSQRGVKIFPIHVAESEAEIDFLQNRNGPFIDFFKVRSGIESHEDLADDFVTSPSCGAVEYLLQLEVLDKRTLCVHTVHVSDKEIEMIAQSGAKVCLCPGSNRFLGVGTAPVSLFLQHGIMPCLGTDSLASNLDLNLWKEMQILREDHPQLTPETIFSFATLGGARALGVEDRLGSLATGKTASFLAVSCSGVHADEIYEYLVSQGSMIDCDWVKG